MLKSKKATKKNMKAVPAGTAAKQRIPPSANLVDFTEIQDGETWELFSRDLLQALGFVIEVPPDRGADGGRDFIAVEHLRGRLGNFSIRWLVSCKHNAHSNNRKSVSPADEQNILERVSAFNASGFFGIYSTLASSGLGQLLGRLRDSGILKEYRILDHKLIEHYLIQAGYSQLISRYLPLSDRRLKPVHALGKRYLPLDCAVCGKDLLMDMYQRRGLSLVQFTRSSVETKVIHYDGVYWSCKGACGDAIERRSALGTAWRDLDALVVPSSYLDFIWVMLQEIRDQRATYSDFALEQIWKLVFALGQKVFREMTDEERARAASERELLSMGF